MSVIVNDEAQALVTVRPLGHQVLIEVLDEVEAITERFNLVLPDQERSQQGIVIAVGDEVDDSPEGVRPGDRVLFDDEDCPYWRGPNPMSYLSVVLGEGVEYVLVPERQLLGVLEEGSDGGDEGHSENAAGGGAEHGT